jgi:hypothetical protein
MISKKSLSREVAFAHPTQKPKFRKVEVAPE